jgi:endonuclease I
VDFGSFVVTIRSYSQIMHQYIKHFLIIIFSVLSVLSLKAQPPGYYSNAEGLSGNELKQALHEIIRNHTRQSYSTIWTLFYSTDRKPNDKVWDMYSDIPPPGTPPYEFTFYDNQCPGGIEPEGSCYNREHTFPVSWWGGGTGSTDTMYTDLFQIHPVDSWVNGHRSNHPYGIVDGPAITMNGSKRGPNAFEFDGEVFTGTVFEPIDAYKGDLARNYFYMMTRYTHRVTDWSDNTPMLADGDLAPLAVAMLIEWHVNDPVSQKEIDRNDSVFLIQGNRNPFVDHPEFVDLIWGDGFAPEPLYHVADFSATTITLTWIDATGPTLPDGYLVRMSGQSFDAIADPVDGVAVEDDFWNRNVGYGVEKVVFGGLTVGVVYYFKIFSYRGSGEGIDYKVDGVPEVIVVAR